jgi:hypothetical protein
MMEYLYIGIFLSIVVVLLRVSWVSLAKVELYSEARRFYEMAKNAYGAGHTNAGDNLYAQGRAARESADAMSYIPKRRRNG